MLHEVIANTTAVRIESEPTVDGKKSYTRQISVPIARLEGHTCSIPKILPLLNDWETIP